VKTQRRIEGAGRAAGGAIRGLYAVTPDIAATGELVRQVEAALAGGARAVQYRNKSADERLRLEQAGALLALCRRHGVPLIINDHPALALAVGADGVHLGAADGSVREARDRLGAEVLVGVSCYNLLRNALDAERAGADYVAFGSFFASAVKPDAVRAPLALLGEAKRVLSIPVVAIGGITLQNARRLIAAGADAVAVISALFAAPDIARAARGFSNLFES
jgi:thiamine-phosphate pyrophosphorylase